MKNLSSGFGNFLSWIATPLVVMCPLCIFTAAFIAVGQVSFLFALARILTPILITLILISILSFYLSYKSHKNLYPFAFSLIGGAGVIYANVAVAPTILFQVFGILLLGTAALIDLNLRLSKREDCEACQGNGSLHSH
ncbi:MAG: hypothetical protein Q8O75_03740 [bacterium]|nr:hypothetical protein [bacterium]